MISRRHPLLLVGVFLSISLAFATPSRAILVWGDVHAHSSLSDDALGGPSNLYGRARDQHQLNFVILSDHDNWLSAEEWQQATSAAEAFYQPGEFVTFVATEWTRGFHMNVYFADANGSICGGGGGPACAGPEEFASFYGDKLLAGEAAAQVNHPINAWPVPWGALDLRLVRNVEIWNSLWDGGIVGPVLDEPAEIRFGGAVWAVRIGGRLGFVGASDEHRVFADLLGTGLTACHADALTRSDVLDALRARRCYATNGERINVAFQIDGTPMGGELGAPVGSTVNAVLSVLGTATPEALEIVHNGEVVAVRDDCPNSVCIFEVPLEIREEHNFVYARVRQPGEKYAWTSPIWIDGICDDPEDCPVDRFFPEANARECSIDWRALPGPDRDESRVLRSVTCVDGDPSCDFDATTGSCTFRVGLCNGDPHRARPGCVATPATAVEIRHPKAPSPSLPPADGLNHLTLTAAANALLSRESATCSPYVDLQVPLRPSSSGGWRRTVRKVRSIATTSVRRDVDGFKLVCLPRI